MRIGELSGRPESRYPFLPEPDLVNPFKGDGWFDEAFLNAQPAVEETEYLRHVRFDAPITIKMDGKKSLGVVLKS